MVVVQWLLASAACKDIKLCLLREQHVHIFIFIRIVVHLVIYIDENVL